jgi:predicted RNase H-like nuclease (RuvC/YqgF family)
MDNLISQFVVGIGGIGAGAWAMYQKIKADNRNNHAADVTGAAWEQVITTLREEVERMSVRLAAVEEQNRKCEEHNEELRRELSDIKMRLHVE